ncbi:MAG: hypothetical protein SOZ28_07415, partial [Clostridia bacterium]|nr:hypothetical protein [Clostridia bacterium]
ALAVTAMLAKLDAVKAAAQSNEISFLLFISSLPFFFGLCLSHPKFCGSIYARFMSTCTIYARLHGIYCITFFNFVQYHCKILICKIAQK